MDTGLLASAFAVAASAARPGDPAGAIDWGMVGAVAGVISVGVAVLGIVAMVAIARWQNRQAKRRGPPADGAADPPGPVFNQPDQWVDQQINIAGGVATIVFGAGPLPPSPPAPRGAGMTAPTQSQTSSSRRSSAGGRAEGKVSGTT
jgi:hypothetical protein